MPTTTDAHNFVRLVLLLHEVGAFLVLETLKIQLEKANRSLAKLLKTNKEKLKLKIKQKHLSKEQFRLLFPESPCEIQESTWDISLLTFVTLFLLQEKCLEIQPKICDAMEDTRNLRNKLAHSGTTDGFDDKSFETWKLDIYYHMKILMAYVPEDKQIHAQTRIGEISSGPLDLANSVKLIKEFYKEDAETREAVQQLQSEITLQFSNFERKMDIIQAQLKDLQAAVEASSHRPIQVVGPYIPNLQLELGLVGSSKAVEKGHDILRIAFDIKSDDASDPGKYETVRCQVKRFLEDMDKGGVQVKKVKLGSVILELDCTTLEDLRHVITFCTCHASMLRLDKIGRLLADMTGDRLDVSVALQEQSINDVMSCIGRGHSGRAITMELDAPPDDDVTQLKDSLASKEMEESLARISAAISNETGSHLRLVSFLKVSAPDSVGVKVSSEPPAQSLVDIDDDNETAAEMVQQYLDTETPGMRLLKPSGSLADCIATILHLPSAYVQHGIEEFNSKHADMISPILKILNNGGDVQQKELDHSHVHDLCVLADVYAVATLLQLPIYLLMWWGENMDCLDWLYFPMLFEDDKILQSDRPYITLYMSAKRGQFQVITADIGHSSCPRTLGFLGMCSRTLEETPLDQIELPESILQACSVLERLEQELLRMIQDELVVHTSERLLDRGLIDGKMRDKFCTGSTSSKQDFVQTLVRDADAFMVFCKTAIQKRHLEIVKFLVTAPIPLTLEVVHVPRTMVHDRERLLQQNLEQLLACFGDDKITKWCELLFQKGVLKDSLHTEPVTEQTRATFVSLLRSSEEAYQTFVQKLILDREVTILKLLGYNAIPHTEFSPEQQMQDDFHKRRVQLFKTIDLPLLQSLGAVLLGKGHMTTSVRHLLDVDQHSFDDFGIKHLLVDAILYKKSAFYIVVQVLILEGRWDVLDLIGLTQDITAIGCCGHLMKLVALEELHMVAAGLNQVQSGHAMTDSVAETLARKVAAAKRFFRISGRSHTYACDEQFLDVYRTSNTDQKSLLTNLSKACLFGEKLEL